MIVLIKGGFVDAYEEKQYTLIDFWMEKGVLRSENIFWSGTESPPNLGAVTIMGVIDSVEEVLVNDVAQAFRYDTIHKVFGLIFGVSNVNFLFSVLVD